MMFQSGFRNVTTGAPRRFAAVLAATICGLLTSALSLSTAAAQSEGVAEYPVYQLPGDDDRYKACMAQISVDPEKALETASQWRALGGGAPARHCAAIAMIAIGAEANAARELTAVGVEGGGFSAEDRAGALTLAGELWLRLEQPDLAIAVFNSALRLIGPTRRQAVGLARAQAMRGNWAAAAEALDPVIAARPDDVEALTLRAAARRSAGDADGALKDAKLATELAPDIALAWFERGAAERALGQDAAARESWIQASILDPQGPNGEPGGIAGELSRRNLQQLALGE